MLSEEYSDGMVVVRALVSPVVAGRLRKAALGRALDGNPMAGSSLIPPMESAAESGCG